jgi:hypothetical protein
MIRPCDIKNILLTLLVCLSQLSTYLVLAQTYEAQIDVSIPRTERTQEVMWAFENGKNGWCNATAEEVQSELWSTGGELRATASGSSPHCDSPPFAIEITDEEIHKHHFCIRLKHNSATARKGVIWVRKWTQSALSHWDQDPDILQGNETAPFTPARTDYSSTPWNEDDYYAVEFDLISQPMVYQTYFVPIYGPSTGFLGNITQFRFFPLGQRTASVGDRWTVDWITVTKAPTIKKVEGCTRSPEAPRNLLIQNSPVVAIGLPWNDGVECVMPGDGTNDYSSRGDVGAFATWCNFGVNNKYFNDSRVDIYGTPDFTALTDDATAQIQDEEYAATFNCQRQGGERVTLSGHNFGDAGAFVYIGGEICTDLVHEEPGISISCTTPTSVNINSAEDALKDVVVINGALQGLSHTVPYLAYAVPADDSVGNITISNVCARSLDLEWEAPSNYWRAVTVTGYYITSRQSDYNASFGDGFVVGNITHTTVIGLEQNTNYQFQIHALVEDQVFSDIWLQLDHYGRRSFPSRAYVDEFTLVGTPGVSPVVRTLDYDFNFEQFTASSTLNHSSSWKLNTPGHLGVFGGEGSYGLIMVGDAALENCNQSAACCDSGQQYAEALNPRLGAKPTLNASSCDMICSGMGTAANLGFSFEYLNGISSPDNVPQSGPGLASQSIIVASPDDYDYNDLTLENIFFTCGSAMRLTPSRARMTGALWYARKQNVREGFTTEFSYRISNPSTVCRIMDGVYTHCRSRGAEGFAFVVHNSGNTQLGTSGMGLGYDQITNSLAVEFDTFFNAENNDQYENAVSVHTRGSQHANSADEAYSLGASTRCSSLVDRAPIPGTKPDTYDYTDGIHRVKIVYTPVFDEDVLMSGRFTASAHVISFLEDADYQYGGQSSWGTGMGTLSIYLDDMLTPLFVIPLNLDATLDLDNGRA